MVWHTGPGPERHLLYTEPQALLSCHGRPLVSPAQGVLQVGGSLPLWPPRTDSKSRGGGSVCFGGSASGMFCTGAGLGGGF